MSIKEENLEKLIKYDLYLSEDNPYKFILYEVIRQKNIDVRVRKNEWDNSPKISLLEMAIKKNDLDMAKYIISLGASTDVIEEFDPLECAKEYVETYNSFSVLEEIIKNTTDRDRLFSLLSYSVYKGWTNIVKRLLKQGIDPSLYDYNWNMTPLELAYNYRRNEIIKLLEDFIEEKNMLPEEKVSKVNKKLKKSLKNLI